MQPLAIPATKIARARTAIPDADFVSATYDSPVETPLARRIVILSTPRSGSTFLCDLFRLNGICIPHEYFQPQEYVPFLADRWGCISEGRLDEGAYVRALIRHRTSAGGVLGINIHGAHVPLFQALEPRFPESPVRYIVVRRRDRIKQAISYEIAGQTRRWSSAFQGDATPQYDFDRIVRRVENLDRQALVVDAFLRARQARAVEIVYEDLVADPAGQLRRIESFAQVAAPVTGAALTRQAAPVNDLWAARFAEDLLAAPGVGPAGRPVSLLARLRRAGARRLFGRP